MQLKTLITSITLMVGMSMSYYIQAATSVEQQHANYMLEEEKLARDLYLSLGAKWDLMPLKNIPSSEQRHFDSMKQLIQSYLKQNPVVNETVGKFNNPELQALYNQLLAQGLKSPQDALQVGGLVEETDIADLQKALADTKDPQSRQVYEELMRGSRNHLRAFASQLAAQGILYKAQVLLDNEVQAILTSPQERGNGQGMGHGGMGHGQGMGRGMGRGQGAGAY
ncbi:MAG: DUF2202 domain-containing protein [Thiofilum sp.]|uniref:DUF2202 domain-containing protein n=1 Tax=Thiofilum sp. TaxID=2212733 RepID=UPI0025D04AF4|nr:DUF2202 domain-containing protein [Thiofilum sp.]MBK8453451.1 DUF2202 domain-containing protein [Thiofilum sp.]